LARLLAIGCGGFLGAVLRYLVTVGVARRQGGVLPLGTLSCNVAGCLLIGVLVAVAEEREGLGEGAQLFLRVGLLGAFTTFSTFGLETVDLLRDGEWGAALLTVLGNLLLGLLAVAGGLALGRWVS